MIKWSSAASRGTVFVAACWLAACGADRSVKLAITAADVVHALDTAAGDAEVVASVPGDAADTSANDVHDTAPLDVCPTGGCEPPVPCGDGTCDPSIGEVLATCPADCRKCGDGLCSPGEGPKTCAEDCCGGCGDGKCVGYGCGESPDVCPEDCGTACGNQICDKGENPGNCPADCVTQVCGNHVCEAFDGGPQTCPQDCATTCGNCVCEKSEDFVSCPNDCGYCGDNTCSLCDGLGETQQTCPADCGDLKLIGCTTAWGLFCQDASPCTDDTCVKGKGCVHLPNTAPCNDGNPCTTQDACAAGACAAGAAVSCDDLNPCTQDGCDPLFGCSHSASSGTPCDDGDPCTTGETCASNACAGGKFVDCDDLQPCTDDACADGKCVHLPNQATCTDGNPCSTDDACVAGKCAGGPPPDCDDGNPCTQDECNLAEGCTSAALDGVACSDGQPCTIGDVCQDKACASGKPIDCDDGNVCSDDACFGGACAHLPNAATCSDANACTENEHCLGSVCSGGSAVACDDSNVCTFDICAAVSGLCVHAPVAGSCDDGLSCTSADHCQLGACTGTPAQCDDANPCTTDGCDAVTGTCQNLAIACDDGVACTLDFCGTLSGCTHVGAAGQQAYVKASAQIPGGHFGKAIALDGDTMVVGAPDESGCASDINGSQLQYGACNGTGAAYVLVRQNGAWSQQAYLKSPNAAASDGFGGSVAIAGDTIVVGAAGQNGSAPGGEGPPIVLKSVGAAYVFVRQGAMWSLQGSLQASNGDEADEFGGAVAIAGDTIVVGARGEASGATGVGGDESANWLYGAGAAYVFRRTGAAWTQEAYLKASNTDSGDYFGTSVGVSGETIVVSAWGESSRSAGINGDQADNMWGGTGAVYVFVREAGLWSQQAYVKASNPNDNDQFGESLAISGDTFVVGSPCEASAAAGMAGNQGDNSLTCAGAAYVFVREAAVWHQEAYLKASNPGYFAQYGTSVAISGDAVVVGAVFENGTVAGVNGVQNADGINIGAAYLFLRKAKFWHQEAYLTASNPANQANVGWAFALSGHTLAVGAVNESSSATGVNGVQTPSGMSQSGAAYVFLTGTGACDDGNPCTIDTCDGVGGCKISLSTGSCDDGNPCTLGEACAAGQCVGGTPNTCDDGNLCTNDSCDVGLGCSHADNSSPCDDREPCTGPDVCQGGSCTTTPLTCDDGDGCTIDSCTYGVGCQNTAVVCDDQNPCTEDVCSAATGQVCANPPKVGAPTCDDGNACTAGDACGSGACVPGPAPQCDDGIACSTDLCNTETGCVFASSAVQVARIKAAQVFANTSLGGAVAIDGDTMVVGASGDRSCANGVNGSLNLGSCNGAGAAFVFVRVKGAWQQQAYLKASNTAAGAGFGASVALAGDTIVIGSPYERSDAKGVNGDQTNSNANYSGAAYVFVRQDGIWTQQAYLKASNNKPYWGFGGAVTVSGDTIAVGAPSETNASSGINGNQADLYAYAPNSGAAYIFVRNSGVWSQQAYLKAAHTDSNNQFGFSLAANGDSLAVGSPGERSTATGVDGSQTAYTTGIKGAAYVFVRQGSVWSQQTYLKPSNTDTNDRFGGAVAMDGDTVVVGAVGESSKATGIDGNQDDNSAASSGAAYVFKRQYGSWSQQAYLKASNTDSGDAFGTCVAVSGNFIAVGAQLESGGAAGINGDQASNTMLYAGATYLFRRHDNTWSQRAYVKPAKVTFEDGFGSAVSLSATTLVVGAPWTRNASPGINGPETGLSASHIGAAYAFGLHADCDDGTTCTSDTCNAATGCQFAAEPGTCEDGDACTVDDVCVGPTCQAGGAKNCDDGNTCTNDSCLVTGVCVSVANTAPCDDLNVCTLGDVCAGSACSHVSEQVCNDGKSCTTDSCDAIGGCKFVVTTSNPELCNGADDDCDGATDEGCDDDGDGYCDMYMYASGPSACGKGLYDCDDTNPDIHPGATDTCGSGVDANCDNVPDSPGSIGCVKFYVDHDWDGYGQAGPTECRCSGGYGLAAVAGDCNDYDTSVFPGHAEWCDSLDNNCNGVSDDGCDADGDGMCAIGAIIIDPGPGKPGNHCPGGGGDCDDTNPLIHPWMGEYCNGKDDNCNGQTDEGEVIGTLYYYDSDGDGYGVSSQSKWFCAVTGFYRATQPGDCNDANTSVNPGVTGSVGCGDSIDNNCNGATDESTGCL